MQTIAVVAIVLAVVLFYKNQTILLRDLLFKLTNNAKHAKFGNFELQLSDEIVVISEAKKQELSILSQILLSTLTSNEVGLLAEISKVDKYAYRGPLLETLRKLRAKGLINYDNKESLASASEVWATDTAKKFLSELEK